MTSLTAVSLMMCMVLIAPAADAVSIRVSLLHAIGLLSIRPVFLIITYSVVIFINK